MLKLDLALLKRLKHDSHGNALMFVGLCFPVLLGGTGLATDTIQWTLTQRQMQRVADSAALAGAFAKAQGSDGPSAAEAEISSHGNIRFTDQPVVESAPKVGRYAGDASAIRIALATEQVLPFSNLFLSEPMRIEVSATAAAMTNGTYCVIALENGNAAGIQFQGNASVDMGCGMATNSKAATAVTAGGSSYVNTTHISAVGGLKSSVSYAPHTVLLPLSTPQKDPYQNLPTPVVPNCSPILNVQPNRIDNVKNPSGVACYRGMDIKGRVNFDPGIYYIDGGTVSIGSQAVITGTNVTFILTSKTASTNPSSIATLDMNGGATVNLKATTSGTYAGVLFYQDRRAPRNITNKVNGNSSSFIQGAIYLPSQIIEYSGGAGMKTDCLQLVSRRLSFTGNANIRNECPANSGAGAFVGTRVYLVE